MSWILGNTDRLMDARFAAAAGAERLVLSLDADAGAWNEISGWVAGPDLWLMATPASAEPGPGWTERFLECKVGRGPLGTGCSRWGFRWRGFGPESALVCAGFNQAGSRCRGCRAVGAAFEGFGPRNRKRLCWIVFRGEAWSGFGICYD